MDSFSTLLRGVGFNAKNLIWGTVLPVFMYTCPFGTVYLCPLRVVSYKKHTSKQKLLCTIPSVRQPHILGLAVKGLAADTTDWHEQAGAWDATGSVVLFISQYCTNEIQLLAYLGFGPMPQ